ncbi:uncharacterized protein LOC127751059 [Frankliniella occidentalis]|uniref:Uncharacterized protein LOC127751059 n=1 Tax=Frankliniella occidentalis TaxID=133901 RepID=A0A9C6XT02_FRAOC|nr:uncharacterized protein LOC127751059 [Frankliniella occidentalis]
MVGIFPVTPRTPAGHRPLLHGPGYYRGHSASTFPAATKHWEGQVMAAWSGSVSSVPTTTNVAPNQSDSIPPVHPNGSSMEELVAKKMVHTRTLQPLRSFLKGKIPRETGVKKDVLVDAVYHHFQT